MTKPKHPKKPMALKESRDILTSARVAFLHGDAALSAREIAKLLDTSVGAAERAVTFSLTKYGHPSFGGWNRAAVALFADLFEKSKRPGIPATVRPDQLAPRVRAMLHVSVPQLLKTKTFTLAKLDAFIAKLQSVLADADVRLGRLRLDFLYGELRASKLEVAEVFDVPMSLLERVLERTKTSQGEHYFSLFVHEHIQLATVAMGASWDYHQNPNDSDERVLSGEQVAFRRFLLKQAREGKVDWPRVDHFLAAESARRAGRR